MSERIDNPARHLAESAPRRTTLLGLAALGLGSLGVLVIGEEADAKCCKN